MSFSFSCPDWEDRLRLGKSLLPKNLPLNKKEAERAVSIFNDLHLPDVVGQPSMAEGAGEWQRDIVRPIFGSLDSDFIRQIREVFALVPKKSSKTTGGAGIMLTALLMNQRPRAEFGLVGPTNDVAELAFRQASGMIDADPEGYLQKRFWVRDHIKTIIDRKNKASLKIKTFDLTVATGGKWSGLLIDELHIMATMSFATRLVGQLRGGLIANPEAFMIFITTQSDQIPAGVFKSELEYARGIRDGRIKNAKTLPLLYEFSEKVQRDERLLWRNPKIWHQVLPNLGKSIHLPRLIEDYETALEKGEEEERRWASQHLNIEIGLGLHDRRWRGADYWISSGDESLNDLYEMLERCDVATAGIDGGGLDDLLGLGIIGRDRETGEFLSWSKAWAQDDVLEKRKDIASRLEDFEKAKEINIIRKGDPVEDGKNPATRDIRELVDIVESVFKLGLFPEKQGIGCDPYSITAIIDELATRGIHTEANGGCITGIRQGSALSPASWGMARKLKDGTFYHSVTLLMNWCVGNAKTEQRGNAELITKETAGKAKIDPLTALFNAFMLMSKNPTAKPNYDLSGWLKAPAVAVG